MSELPLLEKRKKRPFYTNGRFFSFFQRWLAILEPVGVQRHNVPHFKGLIVLGFKESKGMAALLPSTTSF